MIKADSLSFSYNKEKTILSNVSFEINDNDIIAVLGDNGSGKTTLLKIIAGFIKTDKGKITYDDNLSMLYIPANLDYFLLPWYTVGQNISFFLTKGKSIKNINTDEYLCKLKFFLPSIADGFIKKRVFQLSSGEKAVVAFTSAVFCNPKMLLIDELFANTTKNVTLRIIEYLKADKFTIVYTSHNSEFIDLLAKTQFTFLINNE